MASEKKTLLEMQTAESREYRMMMERRDSLLGIIDSCSKTLAGLTESLSVSGLAELCGDVFREWLCDIGMSKLQTSLKDIDGCALTMLTASDIMENDVTFVDAAALQLHGFIAHYKLSDSTDFTPPRDSVLSWDHTQTTDWIRTLGAPFASLVSAGWHGAALCSLSPPRVVEASKSYIELTDAVKFINLIREIRCETDGDKAAWVSKWTGSIPIDNQAM